MKIFISWSEKQSEYVASALHSWIPNVLQTVQPWMSSKNIGAGERWSQQISDELEKTNFGIICVTKNNLNSPWLLFEAGALAKQIKNSYVCPYLINIEPTEIPEGPLSQFQAKTATLTGTKELLKTINSVIDINHRLKEDQVGRTFEKWWPDLENEINSLPNKNKDNDKLARKPEEMIPEILDIVRGIQRKQSKSFLYNNVNKDLTNKEILKQILSNYIKYADEGYNNTMLEHRIYKIYEELSSKSFDSNTEEDKKI